MGVGTDKLFEQFSSLNVWKKGDQRAPHKPLVLLAALARVQRGQSRLVSFEESAETISVLLDDFGPARKTQHPEQ
jgi:putative restriction endonuclease